MKNISIAQAEALKKFNLNIDQRIPVISTYLLLMLILREGLSIPFPYTVFGLITFMILSSLVLAVYLINFTPEAQTIINGFFFYILFDLFILTIVIYFLGGISWIGFVFYSFYLILNFMTFSRSRALFLTIWIIILFLGLVFSQYFQILPFQSLFLLKNQVHTNFSYVVTTIVTITSTFFLVAYYSRGFYRMYETKIRTLQKIYSVLQKEKSSLKTRVRTRQKELEFERKSIAEKIRAREKELKNEEARLEEQAVELETFRKVAKGRELKLRELEIELNQLRIKQKP